jgi:hypothetical protein
MNTSALLARRIVQLLVGLVAYGFAIAMMVRAALGVPPWDVLTQGLMLQTGLPFGVLTNIIGALVLLLWIPIRQKPGIGTIANVLLVGPSIELGLAFIAAPTELWQRVLLFAGGLTLLAIASGLYIGARFGPGPRDGLMTGKSPCWASGGCWAETSGSAPWPSRCSWARWSASPCRGCGFRCRSRGRPRPSRRSSRDCRGARALGGLSRGLPAAADVGCDSFLQPEAGRLASGRSAERRGRPATRALADVAAW